MSVIPLETLTQGRGAAGDAGARLEREYARREQREYARRAGHIPGTSTDPYGYGIPKRKVGHFLFII